MIEKIMKAVKSGNKKRGRNITIGAVVGFLLSCTVAIGADEYLWIKNDSGIKFSTDNNLSTSTDNPYSENNWDGSIYINNIALSGTDNDSSTKGYGLKLEGDLGEFKLINNGSIAGTATGSNGYSYGIYNNSGTIATLTNNGLITGTATGSYGSGYGIYKYSGTIATLANNGLITGTATGSNVEGYGIYNNSGSTIESLANNGLIIGNGEGYGGQGIYNSGIIKSLINNGLITGAATESNGRGRGIYNNSGTIENLANNGLIIGNGKGDGGYGIYNQGSSSMTDVINNGLIAVIDGDDGNGIKNAGTIDTIENNGFMTSVGNNSSHGISNAGVIRTITNTGIIYGQTNAVNNEANSTITSLDNYGILATKGSSAINNDGTITTENNYGLYIAEGKVSFDASKQSNSPVEILVGHDDSGTEIKREMIIKNAELEGNSGSATSTKSITFSGTENYNKHILNGKDKTITASGSGEILGSIINAYGTAVAFDGTDSQLTLSGTIVNGGSDGTNNSITGSGNGDTLILQSGDITYVGSGSPASQNTVINGNIDMADGIDTITVDTGAIINGTVKMGAGDDVLNIISGGKINGTLDGGTGDDTLNLGATTSNTRALSNGGISIRQNVSDFENININGNVTVFETTVGNDGKTTDLKISGVDTVTIGETGVLNLRLKDAGTTTDVGGNLIPNAGHAFLGNNMIIQGEGNGVDTAGTLNFVTNGIGREIYVDMTNIELKNLYIKTSSVIDGYKIKEKEYALIGVKDNLDEIYRPENTRGSSLTEERYESLNNIYKGIYSSTDENLNALRILISFDNFGNNYEENMSDDEQLKNLMSYLNSIYAETPYSFSSELSRKSTGMFRDIVTENHFRPDLNKWMIMGGLTHADGGTKDTYYGQNYHGFDGGTADTDVDMKLTGAYALGKYGYSENVSLGVTVGGNKSEAELSMSKVEGSSGYIGAFVENYRGNLTLKAGGGIQYSEYDADRRTIGGHSYDEKYSDMAYDIYLNGRYSHNIGNNLFLEPYATLSYTYIDQDGANEGSKVLAIETDSKSFDYTVGKAGLDLKKVIPHEKGKSTLSAGVSYTKILDGADEEHITGRFKGGTDFDILVAHKNEHSIGVNAKYALELENGILFDVKGTYAVERDSHNGAGKNKAKGEWIVGAGLGYKF